MAAMNILFKINITTSIYYKTLVLYLLLLIDYTILMTKKSEYSIRGK